MVRNSTIIITRVNDSPLPYPCTPAFVHQIFKNQEAVIAFVVGAQNFQKDVIVVIRLQTVNIPLLGIVRRSDRDRRWYLSFDRCQSRTWLTRCSRPNRPE